MIQVRYYDIAMKTEERKETKSGDEIVKDIVARAGLEIK